MRKLGAEQKENLGIKMSNSHLNIQETQPMKTTKPEDTCGT